MKVQVILKNREALPLFRPYTKLYMGSELTIIGSYREVCESTADPVGPTSHWEVFVPGGPILVT